MTAKERGDLGERLATEHYTKQGYTLLSRNFRSRFGELDIVAQKGGLLVVCEVKTRSGSMLDTPSAWVDSRKQARIIKTTLQYLAQKALGEPMLRFDVVEVCFDKDEKATLNCIENAFMAG